MFSEIYDKLEVCDPVYFFWGKKRVCRKKIKEEIEKIKHSEAFENEMRDDDDDNVANNNDDKNGDKNEEYFYDIQNLYSDIKKHFQSNHLAIVNFIHSIHKLIYIFIDKLISVFI